MWYIEYGGMKNGVFRRNIYKDSTSKEELISTKEYFNSKDFYNSIYIYDNIKNIKDSNIYGSFIMDLDKKIDNEKDYQMLITDLIITTNTLKTLFCINEDEIFIFFSGSKGFHVVIPPKVLGITPCKDLNVKYKKMANIIKDKIFYDTLDTKIYDKRRLIRVSSTINNKTGLYKVPISLKTAKSLSLKELKEYASKPRGLEKPLPKTVNLNAKKKFEDLIKIKKEKKKTKNVIINKNKKIPRTPCTINLFTNGVSKGQRNNASVVFSSIFLQNGFSVEETLQWISMWNEEKNDPALPEYEIKSTVMSAYNMLKQGRVFGCNALSEVSECSIKCPFYNKK